MRSLGIDLAVSADHAWSHGGVREDLFVFEATQLSLARLHDAMTNNGRAVSVRRLAT
jgi:hypothetical protein